MVPFGFHGRCSPTPPCSRLLLDVPGAVRLVFGMRRVERTHRRPRPFCLGLLLATLRSGRSGFRSGPLFFRGLLTVLHDGILSPYDLSSYVVSGVNIKEVHSRRQAALVDVGKYLPMILSALLTSLVGTGSSLSGLSCVGWVERTGR